MENLKKSKTISTFNLNFYLFNNKQKIVNKMHQRLVSSVTTKLVDVKFNPSNRLI